MLWCAMWRSIPQYMCYHVIHIEGLSMVLCMISYLQNAIKLSFLLLMFNQLGIVLISPCSLWIELSCVLLVSDRWSWFISVADVMFRSTQDHHRLWQVETFIVTHSLFDYYVAGFVSSMLVALQSMTHLWTCTMLEEFLEACASDLLSRLMTLEWPLNDGRMTNKAASRFSPLFPGYHVWYEMDMHMTRYEWIGFYKRRIFEEGGVATCWARIDRSTLYMEYISFKSSFKFSLRGSQCPHTWLTPPWECSESSARFIGYRCSETSLCQSRCEYSKSLPWKLRLIRWPQSNTMKTHR